MRHSVTLVLLVSFNVALTVPVGVTIGLSPHAFDPIQSLYHAQDNVGHYVYGYATPTAAKTETKSTDGVTRGGYSYIDTNGYLQTVQYTADAIHGFRVAATNLPKDLPDVAYARAKHISDYEAIKAEHAKIAELSAVPYFNPVSVPSHAVPAVPINQQLPQPVTDLPEVVKARNEHLAALREAYTKTLILPQPVQDLPEVVKARAEHLAAVERTKQEHETLKAQIVLSPVPDYIEGGVVPVKTAGVGFEGQGLPIAQTAQVSYTPVAYGKAAEDYQYPLIPYSYGYVGPHSAHSESRAEDGVTRGGYSYIDARGVIQTVKYMADASGFRVAASNLPVDPNHFKLSPEAHPPVQAAPVGKVVIKAVEPTHFYKHEIVY